MLALVINLTNIMSFGRIVSVLTSPEFMRGEAQILFKDVVSWSMSEECKSSCKVQGHSGFYMDTDRFYIVCPVGKSSSVIGVHIDDDGLPYWIVLASSGQDAVTFEVRDAPSVDDLYYLVLYAVVRYFNPQNALSDFDHLKVDTLNAVQSSPDCGSVSDILSNFWSFASISVSSLTFDPVEVKSFKVGSEAELNLLLFLLEFCDAYNSVRIKRGVGKIKVRVTIDEWKYLLVSNTFNFAVLGLNKYLSLLSGLSRSVSYNKDALFNSLVANFISEFSLKCYKCVTQCTLAASTFVYLPEDRLSLYLKRLDVDSSVIDAISVQ